MDLRSATLCHVPSVVRFHATLSPWNARDPVPPVGRVPARATWIAQAGTLEGSDPEQNSSKGQSPRKSRGEGTSSPWGQGWAGRASAARKKHAPKGSGAPLRRPSQSTANLEGRAGSQEKDPEMEAAIRANVDRAAALLDEIIKEVNQQMFTAEATAYLYDEQPEVQMSQAIQAAVASRLDLLDGNFLAALNAYNTAAKQLPPSPLSQLLSSLRAEVLNQVAQRMPPAVRVLNAALGHASRSSRLEVLQTALEGGSSSSRGGGQESTAAVVPGVDLEPLSAAAVQLVDDMEDQQLIADRVLLVRLVLLREELRAIAGKQAEKDMMATAAAAPHADPAVSSSSTTTGDASDLGGGDSPGPEYASAADGGFFAYNRTNLPRQCAAFLKELLGVGSRQRRLGLIQKAFQDDWDMAGKAGKDQQEGEAPDVLRPGRFLTTLNATRKELEQAYVAGTLAVGAGQDDGGTGLLKRLDEIEFESLVVLDQLQQGGGDKGALESGGGIDYTLGEADGIQAV